MKPQRKNDPLWILLARIAGVDPSASRALTAAQFWSKSHFPALKPQFTEEFAQSGLHEDQRAKERQSFMSSQFEALPTEEQKYWATRKDAYNASMKKANPEGTEIALLEPEECQE